MKTALIAGLCSLGILLVSSAVASADDAPGHAKPAEVDAPLPEGWPEPTAPGEIAVKEYPAYRSAVAQSGMKMDRADNLLFWQLFAHIKANDIAMTAPVVNTYSGESKDDRKVEMEFLYRTTKQGSTGDGLGQVDVLDHPSRTFVTIGVQGKMNEKVYQTSLEKLENWLADHPKWKRNGDPRRLGYHGPMTDQEKRLWEVQIPVEAK